jgi:hypothetical protein
MVDVSAESIDASRFDVHVVFNVIDDESGDAFEDGGGSVDADEHATMRSEDAAMSFMVAHAFAIAVPEGDCDFLR